MERVGETTTTKGFVMVKSIWIWLLMALTSSAFGMVSSSTDECPNKFVGKVEKIIQAEAPLNPRSTDRVVLKLEEVIRGSVKDHEEIQVLTYSSLKFSPGESYVLELRNGKICSVVSLNEHHE
jgi:hypothetical protein